MMMDDFDFSHKLKKWISIDYVTILGICSVNGYFNNYVQSTVQWYARVQRIGAVHGTIYS